MSHELELIDYINIIYLKNQLVCLPVEKLLEKYQKEDMYGLFLDTVSLMIEHDRGFFLLCPDGISKVEDIIQKYRFLYPDSDFTLVTNHIICYLNSIRSSTMIKDIIKENYLDWHSRVRKIEFSQEEDFLYITSYDAVSHYKLLGNQLDEVEDVPFLSSLNYFIEVIPELFDEPILTERVSAKLLDISSQRGFRKRAVREFLKETVQNFQKVKK